MGQNLSFIETIALKRIVNTKTKMINNAFLLRKVWGLFLRLYIEKQAILQIIRIEYKIRADSFDSN